MKNPAGIVISNVRIFDGMDEQLFDSMDILRQATSNGGRALRMCGKLYPYPGDLGVIREGAMADMLIVKDNPLDDVSILSNYEEQLLFIMKDGKIYKNLLDKPFAELRQSQAI